MLLNVDRDISKQISTFVSILRNSAWTTHLKTFNHLKALWSSLMMIDIPALRRK